MEDREITVIIMHKCHYCYLKSGPWDLWTLSAVGDDGLEGDTFPDSLTGESKTINEKSICQHYNVVYAAHIC